MRHPLNVGFLCAVLAMAAPVWAEGAGAMIATQARGLDQALQAGQVQAGRVQAGRVQGGRGLPVTCLLSPARVANIASQNSGLVANVAVRRADVVAKDQVLVQLDDRLARADLDLATITRDALGAKLGRSEKLEDSRMISRDEIETMRADYAVAKAQVARAELMVKMTQITAPFAGVIAQSQVEAGEVIANTAILQLIDISTLKVEMVFVRDDFGTMKLGQNLDIVVDLVSKTVPATITSVDPFLDASSNTFSVVAQVDNADLTLPSGANCSLAPAD